MFAETYRCSLGCRDIGFLLRPHHKFFGQQEAYRCQCLLDEIAASKAKASKLVEEDGDAAGRRKPRNYRQGVE